MGRRTGSCAAVIALAMGAGGCTSDDLAAFSEGLAMAADNLDAELNACPPGLVRRQSYQPYVPGVSGYGGQVVYYGLTPYQVNSYCDYPYYPPDEADRNSETYRDGYEEGYRDGRRRDRARDDER
jgi:hypothetical protein